MRPSIIREKLTQLLHTKFMNVFEYPFGTDGHYYTASRRAESDLVMLKSDEEYKNMTADAVTCMVVIECPGAEPKLLMNYEFRYPLGRFLLAPPAGLIDPEDKGKNVYDSLISTARREINEETGIEITEGDQFKVINPLLFSSPGMTDESNAIVCAVIKHDPGAELNHTGSVGSEVFDGFKLLTVSEAKDLLDHGMDSDGFFYSVFTWICLIGFTSGMWKE